MPSGRRRNTVITKHIEESISEGLTAKQGYEVYLKEGIADLIQKPPMGQRRYLNIFYEIRKTRSINSDSKSKIYSEGMRTVSETVVKMPKSLFVKTVKKSLGSSSEVERDWAKNVLSTLALAVAGGKNDLKKLTEPCNSPYLCTCDYCNKELLKKLFRLEKE